MAKLTEQDRRRAVEQTLANWKLEGFDPDPKYLGLLDRYIAGALSTDDLRRYLDDVPIVSL